MVENSRTLERGLARLEAPTDDPDAGMGNIIRLSPNDRVIYELQPELQARTYHGATVTTDQRGFRVHSVAPPAREGELTIVGIGDSIMFGDGIEDGETFLAVLQELLLREHPERAWRVVNTAVPGYNTVMEVETLRTKALDLRPDLVLLNVVSNDFAPPKYVRNQENPFTLAKSFLAEFVGARIASSASRHGSFLAPNGALGRGSEWWEADEGGTYEVPEKYRQVFGRDAFCSALDQLRELSRAHGFDVIVFSTYDHENVSLMREEARAREFPCFDMMDDLEAWLRENVGLEFTPDSYSRSALVVSRSNTHPSPLQHRMVAERLLGWMRELGLVEKYLGRE